MIRAATDHKNTKMKNSWPTINLVKTVRALVLLFTCSSSLLIQSALACPDRGNLVDINCDGQVVIVAFGDSITAGLGDEQNLGGWPTRVRTNPITQGVIVVNVGISGERTYQAKGRAGSVFSTYHFADYVVLLEGVNDYWLNISSNTTRNNLLSVINSASQATDAVILLGNLTAVRRHYQIGWVNSVNSRIAGDIRINFFSLGESIISSDNLHPNAAGYQRMAAERVIPGLQTWGQLNRPADTDGDGMYDFAEIKIGSDPNDEDTDDDGLLDGDEVFNYNSSPTLEDTDDDGFSDPYEVNVLGSDPSNPFPGPPYIVSHTFVTP